MSMKAIVKSVLSGDSLVLRGRPGAQGQPPKERILHLADIVAPRPGTSSREDEPWAFESREFLRARLVGKEISFTVSHSLPPSSSTPASADDAPVSRDIGAAELAGRDIASEVLKNGWAKLKELKRDREPTEEDTRKKELEAEARSAGLGVWNPHGQTARAVHHTMPVDSAAFMAEWKGKPLDGIVEQVKDGSTLRVRLFLPEGDHQVVNLALAGVRSARAAGKPGESSEPFGEEGKYFTETRLLQRSVKATLLSLPGSTAASPFQSNGTAPSAPTASIFIGTVMHPAGNVAEFLVSAGLARVVDWHAGMLSSTPGAMERLRAAEKQAKEKRLGLYATSGGPGATGAGGKTDGGPSKPSVSGSRTWEGVVVRVWTGDQVSIVDSAGRERRVQLSSVRGPKMSDPKQAYYAHEAREFLRKKLIGKHVKVYVDYIKPKDGEFEERECVTVRYGGGNSNVAEQLIEKGLASVIRHKRDDEDRSSDFDKLMVAEQTAVTETKGIHSGKDQQPPKAPLNLSENVTRSNQYLNGFKRQGRVPALVEYVASGSRFKIFLPKDNQVLTLVLAGIRAPRTARNSSEKSEPFGQEASDYATRHYMQRDIEFEVDTVDKAGGFIGSLYVNKTENAALALVKEGLASVHGYSAEGLSWVRQLYDSEADAKKAKKGIWKEYDEEAEKAAEAANNVDDSAPLKTNFMDIIISDVRPAANLTFSVQILNTEGIASLEKLMSDFSLHHKVSGTAPPGFTPRGGDLVSAKFSDGQWYRAKVRRASPIKKEAELTFIDYGNQDTVAFSNIRPLDPKFRGLPGQAHDARLSFVQLLSPDSEYHPEALDRFRALAEGRKLIANVDHKEGNLMHLRLIDPSELAAKDDPFACINVDLVREGYAIIDKKGCRYLASYPAAQKKLNEANNEAKKYRAGRFELGDVDEDD